LEGGSRGLVEGIFLSFAYRDWKITTKTSQDGHFPDRFESDTPQTKQSLLLSLYFGNLYGQMHIELDPVRKVL